MSLVPFFQVAAIMGASLLLGDTYSHAAGIALALYAIMPITYAR